MAGLLRRSAAGLLAIALVAACAARASEDLVDQPPARPAPEASDAVGAERQALLRAKLTTALTQLAPLKMMSLEYWMTNGEWPARAADIGLDAAQLTSSVIAAVSLERNGTIVAELVDDFGKNAELRLAPHAVMGGTSFEWRCSASVAPAIVRTLPCEPQR